MEECRKTDMSTVYNKYTWTMFEKCNYKLICYFCDYNVVSRPNIIKGKFRSN